VRLPFYFYFLNFQFSFFFLINLIGFSVYFTIISGLIRNSKYSFIGAIRSRSQRVSFEIIFSIYIIIFIIFLNSLSLFYILNLSFFLIFYPFLIIVLAELNRAPFDFSEGERELVSGFNTEHSRVSFIFLFLGEYGVLIFFSVLRSLFFFEINFLFIFFYFSLLLLIRRSYPRYRYDKLIKLF